MVKLVNDDMRFQIFVDRFNRSNDNKPVLPGDIDAVEKRFNIFFPSDYREFLQKYGDVWTPDILDIVVDSGAAVNDLQQFWDIERIIQDKTSGWTSAIPFNLMPFASDSMGNIFGFKTDDLGKRKETADIYFFDHDFDAVDKIANGFSEWLNIYNCLRM